MKRQTLSLMLILAFVLCATGVSHARYYDPESGRFISQDPARYIDGPNLYQYVGSYPTNATDPTGLQIGIPVAEAEMIAAGLSAEEISLILTIPLATVASDIARYTAEQAQRDWKRFLADALSKAAAKAKRMDPCPPPPDECSQAQQALKMAEKALDSFQERIAEHQKKIEDFRRDPANYPTPPGNSKPAVITQQYIDNVINGPNGWLKQIDTFKQSARTAEQAIEIGKKDVEKKCQSATSPFAVLAVACLGLLRLFRGKRNKYASPSARRAGRV